MITKISALIAVIEFAVICIAQSQSPAPRGIAFSVANACKASRHEKSQGDASPGDASDAVTVTWQIQSRRFV
jgi:hypothetical protein